MFRHLYCITTFYLASQRKWTRIPNSSSGQLGLLGVALITCYLPKIKVDLKTSCSKQIQHHHAFCKEQFKTTAKTCKHRYSQHRSEPYCEWIQLVASPVQISISVRKWITKESSCYDSILLSRVTFNQSSHAGTFGLAAVKCRTGRCVRRLVQGFWDGCSTAQIGAH